MASCPGFSRGYPRLAIEENQPSLRLRRGKLKKTITKAASQMGGGFCASKGPIKT
jgi:hypothetical protein